MLFLTILLTLPLALIVGVIADPSKFAHALQTYRGADPGAVMDGIMSVVATAVLPIYILPELIAILADFVLSIAATTNVSGNVVPSVKVVLLSFHFD